MKKMGLIALVVMGLASGCRAGWLNPSQPGFVLQTYTTYQPISGNNSGTILTNGNSYQYAGDNSGLVFIGGPGAQFRGKNEGTLNLDSEGGYVMGAFGPLAVVTNRGKGSLLLGNLSGGQRAVITDVAHGSLLLGAGVVSNAQAIVVGDDNASHGAKSVTAGSFWAMGLGFFGKGTGLTDLREYDTNALAAVAALHNNLEVHGALTTNAHNLVLLLAGKSGTNHDHQSVYYPLAGNPSGFATNILAGDTNYPAINGTIPLPSLVGPQGIQGPVGPQGPAGPAGSGVVLPENPADLADYQWVTNGVSITITNYVGAGGALVVPMAINGLPVTRIESSAFASDASITSITVPDGILSIGNNAFAFLNNVTRITLPNSVTNIGMGLMNNDPLLGSFMFPNKLTVIPESTLDTCGGLTNVVLPPGLTRIDGWAFGYCEGLTSFEIPDGMSEIAAGVFGGCGLTNVTLSANITNIGDYAFAGCRDLVSVRFKGNAPALGSGVFATASATCYYVAGRTGFDEAWQQAADSYLGLWECEILYANGGNLTGLTPGQIGAVWKTNCVITAIETNEAGAVVGFVTESIVYLGVP